ncbi:hypothetical protein DITRI_Ditri08aG0021300 [Diplodiscus trichospermus]
MLGYNPSFVWRGIWTSQALVRSGCRWKIGDGLTINAWSDPWLRNAENFHVTNPVMTGMESLLVHALFIPGRKEWDVELMSEMFNTEDADAILSIPLGNTYYPDQRIWNFSKDGSYTVRSAYRVAIQLFFPYDIFKVTGDWWDLWNLKVPPKIKAFLWRLGINVLPNRDNLRSKGVQVPLECVFCNGELENSWHSFINCSYAQQCWNLSGLSQRVNSVADDSEGMIEWLFKVMRSVSEDERCCIAVILWGIWRERNQRCWNNKVQTPGQVIYSSKEMLYDWVQVHVESKNNTVSGKETISCHQWHGPPAAYLKFNIDASLFIESSEIGMGAVLRDEQRNLVAARMDRKAVIPKVCEAEVSALHGALSWVRDMGYESYF